MTKGNASNSTDFETKLKDPSVACVRDYSVNSRKLLVAFGGINLGLGMVPFEFFQLAKNVPAKKLFFRDLAQAWYHRGLPGVGENALQIADFLRAEIQAEEIEHTVLVGNSMGGYAALLFGALAGAQQVCAFAPQTFIGPFDLFRARDFRWKRRIWRAYLSLSNREYFDVRNHLQNASKVRAAVHYSATNSLDSLHAKHLTGLANVTLHPHAEGGHRVIRSLRDSGQLGSIIEQLLEPHT